MNKIKFTICLLTTCIIFISGCDKQIDGKGEIEVTVKLGGKPAAPCMIRVVNDSKNYIQAVDVYGKANFPKLEAGKYTVSAQKKNPTGAEYFKDTIINVAVRYRLNIYAININLNP